MGQLNPLPIDDVSKPTPLSTAQPLSRSVVCLWYCVIMLASSWTMGEGRTYPLVTDADTHGKRSATSEMGVADYPDYQSGIRYDEYPVVVPKRTALLLDKVMVALQKAMEDETKPTALALPSRIDMSEKMDLQRRGQPKGRVYWRCYFNAVTCFKRK